MSRIHLSAPDVRPAERAAVVEALDSGWLAPVGPNLEAFEVELAELSGRAQAVAVASGTAALHLALEVLGVGPGDDVLVSTFTFVASASPVVQCGATPVFIDSDESDWNMSAELVSEELDHRRRTGRAMPRAAIVVDLYGQCADYQRLGPLLEEHGVILIEDAAEAVGASCAGRPAGSFGRVGIYSFNGNKLITTSGGGALVCDDEATAARVRHLATQAREPAPHYEHTELGYNYRLSNLLAAVGSAQLSALGPRIERRRGYRSAYHSAFSGAPGVRLNPLVPGRSTNHWLTCIAVEPMTAGFSAAELREHLDADDIEARPTWKPMHLQPVFAEAPRRVDGTSERLFAMGLCLPSGSGMADRDLDRVLDSIEAFLAARG